MNVSIKLKDIEIIDINGVFKYCTFIHKTEIIKRRLILSDGETSHHYSFTYNNKKYHIPSKYNYMIDNKYEEWREKRRVEILKYAYVIEELGEKYDKTRKSN